MTDFLSWWAAHWPLVPVLIAVVLWYNRQFWLIGQMLKRRREP